MINIPDVICLDSLLKKKKKLTFLGIVYFEYEYNSFVVYIIKIHLNEVGIYGLHPVSCPLHTVTIWDKAGSFD